MHCPQCAAGSLSPIKLEPSLAALGCNQCDGALLSLVAYRLWRELHVTEVLPEVYHATEPVEPGAAILCPRCKRIMLRFRYTTESANVLDVCSHCDDVWLQENEWCFLKGRSLQGDLTAIFTEPWQRSLRKKRTRAAMEVEWEQRLGPELHSQAREMRSRLHDHPNRASFLDYLLSPDPYDA